MHDQNVPYQSSFSYAKYLTSVLYCLLISRTLFQMIYYQLRLVPF